MSNAFERYAPFIQDYIYRSGWRSLRAVQAAAADAIFDTDDNVLLLASTASGKTEADGLACPSPSGFVTRLVTNLVSGDFTVSDGRLYDFLRLLYRSEQIEIEPSSCAAFMGPIGLVHFPDAVSYCQSHGLTDGRMERSTQICWATGGSMIPENIREQYREKCLPVPEF